MKLLRQLEVKKSETYINLICLFENKGKYELWFSSKAEMIEAFENDIAQVNDFLNIAKSAPGKVPCKFTFAPKQDNDGLHLIFRGNLFTALLFLREISLESVEPAIDLIVKLLKDCDETEFNDAFAKSTSSSKKPTINNLKHYRNDSDSEVKTSSDNDEKTPLLPKPVFVK